mmetsp:Transcript_7507/g.20013  ORF Transcript_7507/g.20013 Transcript_7507/m.20013 type:complete len:99 (+) Transcript_7507:47-343(+)
MVVFKNCAAQTNSRGIVVVVVVVVVGVVVVVVDSVVVVVEIVVEDVVVVVVVATMGASIATAFKRFSMSNSLKPISKKNVFPEVRGLCHGRSAMCWKP